MATLRRALLLLPLLFHLLFVAACGSAPGPDEPALAAATGIPVGAPNAAGVSFDGAGAAATAEPAEPAELGLPTPHPLPLPKTLPPDPFDPMDGAKPADPGPGTKVKPPKKKGMQL